MIKINIDDEKVNRNWLHRKVINVKKLFKVERGTHMGSVQVKRGGTIFTRQQRVGKKPSGRTGTGKMDKFPESVKKEILDQRSFGLSGAAIKEFIESKIDHEWETFTPSKNKERQKIIDKKISDLIPKIRSETDKSKADEMRDKRDKLLVESRELIEGKNVTYFNGKPVGNLVESKLINDEGKLTVTSQALTDWAKKQGVESSKKRTSGLSREKESHSNTKKELDRSTKKIAELEVRGKHANEEFKLLQRQKQESDKLKLEYAQKLRACLDRNK